jgi:hypothetical protein
MLHYQPEGWRTCRQCRHCLPDEYDPEPTFTDNWEHWRESPLNCVKELTEIVGASLGIKPRRKLH